MGVPEGTKRRRFGGPRSKTGCLVCRQRHIQCDEAKPSCGQCVLAKWSCQYAQPPAANVVARSEPANQGQPSQHHLSTQPDYYSDLSDFERKSLHYFTHTVADSLFRYLDSDFWTFIVPQRFQGEVVVRSAVVALSSIHLEFATARNLALSETLPECSLQSLHLYNIALGELLRYMRDSPAPSKSQILISCAAFVCFDMMRGKQMVAMQHLDKGASILSSWRDAVRKGTCRRSCWDYEQILNTFTALDIHATTYDDDRVPTIGSGQGNGDGPAAVPDFFADIRHAQNILMRLLSEALAHLCHSTPYKYLPMEQVPTSFVVERQAIRRAFAKWSLAADAFDKIANPQSDKTYSPKAAKAAKAMQVMRTQLVAVEMVLDETLQPAGMVWPSDARNVEILNRASVAVEEASNTEQGPLRGFSVDLGLAAPLFLLALKTADPAIRDQAVWLISQLRHLEGWHSPHAMAATANQLIAQHNRLCGEKRQMRCQSVEAESLDELAACVRYCCPGDAIGIGKMIKGAADSSQLEYTEVA